MSYLTFPQEALSFQDADLGDSANRMKHEEAEIAKVESKFQFLVQENEKLKDSFATERAAFKTQEEKLDQTCTRSRSSA